MDDAIEDRIRTAIERMSVLDDERTVAAAFLAMSVYMFREAGTYSDTAGLFPRVVSGVAIVGCVLIVAQTVLPDPVREVVSSDTDVFSTDDLSEEQSSPDGDDAPAQEFDSLDSVVTAVLIVAYAVLSLYVGFLIATPLFVLAYGLWKGLAWPVLAALVVGTTGAVFVIGDVLNISVEYAILQMGVVLL